MVGEHTYLFSGDQFVRYTGTEYDRIDLGYPRRLSELSQEPRFAGLSATLTGVDAAFADRGSVYLFSGGQIHAVSTAAYRRYDALAQDTVGCAVMDDGGVYIEHPDGWHRYSALEGFSLTTPLARPRALRGVPAEFRTGLDAVLEAVDGTTYLFKDAACWNTRLGKEYPLAEEWGRPRNNLYHDNAVDAAFVGVDDKTYVFSGDQFVVYPGLDYLDAAIEGAPRPVAEHWGGLSRVALAYVRDGLTYLFEPPDADGSMWYVVYSGKNYDHPDEGYPASADASFFGIPDEYRPESFTLPDAVLFTADTMLLLTGGLYLQHDETRDVWSYRARWSGSGGCRPARRVGHRLHRPGRRHVRLLRARVHPPVRAHGHAAAADPRPLGPHPQQLPRRRRRRPAQRPWQPQQRRWQRHGPHRRGRHRRRVRPLRRANRRARNE